MSRTIRTPEELNDCLLENDRSVSHWELNLRRGGNNAQAAFDERIESIVENAPHNTEVLSIDLSLRGLTGSRAAGIAEMLRLLPGLLSVRLQVGQGRRPNSPSPSDKELKDAASLIVGGLARNDKSSLVYFCCEVDCGPEAILALFDRHSELETLVLHCPDSPDFADATAHGLTRLRSLKAILVDSKVKGPVQTILPACFTLQLRELTVWLANLPDPKQTMRSLLSCMPTLEILSVASDQSLSLISLQGPISSSLQELSIRRCAFADENGLPSTHPSFVNRTLLRLHFEHCTFAHETLLLLLQQQFQGLEKLSFESCSGPLVDQSGPWHHLIRGLPSLQLFRAGGGASDTYPEQSSSPPPPPFPTNAVLYGVASALAIREKPLDLDLFLNPGTPFAPALYALVRHCKRSFELIAAQLSGTNLDHVCRGLKAPNCQLQKLSLTLNLAARRDRDLTAVFEATRCCQHLQSLILTANPSEAPTYTMDDSACQALSDLLHSSTVLSILHLNRFAMSLEGFGRVVSGLAACKTARSVIFHDGSLHPGSLGLLRSRLDDVAQLEVLDLHVANNVGPDLLGFLREASHKLPKLRSLTLAHEMSDEDQVAREAAADACVDFVKTNTSLIEMEILELEKSIEVQDQKIQFYTSLNGLGRRYLHPSYDSMPLSLWPTILARMTGENHQGELQYFLRHKPALVQTRNGGMRRNHRGDFVNAATNASEGIDD